MAEKCRKEPAFEEALAKLERIVQEMEDGDLGLEEGLKRFEAGISLARFCEAKLGETQKRIEILLKDSEAGAEWQQTDFDLQPDDE